MSSQKSNWVVIVLATFAVLCLVVVTCAGTAFFGLAYAQHQREVQKREAVENNLREISRALSKHKAGTASDFVSQYVIGRWSETIPDGATTIESTIYRKDDKLFIDHHFSDGSLQTLELVEAAATTGSRYDPIPASETGDYFLINDAGDLQTWDEAGLVSTAKKIK